MQELSSNHLALAVVLAALDRRSQAAEPKSEASIASECLYLLDDPRLAPTLIWLDHGRPRKLDDEQLALSEETKEIFRRIALVIRELSL